MSLLNINLAILAYSDGPQTNSPNLRLADAKWSMMGLPTNNFRNMPISLAPGESMTIASTSRGLSFNSSTSFQIDSLGDKMRITARAGQRVARNTGDSTTVWAVSQNGSSVRLTATGGTVPNFGNFLIGDTVKLGDSFSLDNKGDFTIMSKGQNYVEYVNVYAQAEDTITNAKVSVYSNGPVQKGDILDITSSAFAFPNTGAFAVTSVTDEYIEVLNPSAFTQTVTGVTSGLAVYPYAYKWMVIAADRKILVGLNGSAPSSIEVEPPVEGDLVRNPGLFVKRGKVFEIQITNVSTDPVQGFLMLGE